MIQTERRAHTTERLGRFYFRLVGRMLLILILVWAVFSWMSGDQRAAVLVRGIPYGDHPRQVLDLYIPRAAKNPETVIFFYGGRWKSGERGQYRFVARALAARGYSVAIPDYRLYPEVRFPSFLEDGARAVAWVDQHIKGYGGNSDQIILMGHSAGAYNAIMLALNRSYLSRAGVEPKKISSAIGIAGPYDFLPFIDGGASDFKEIFKSSSGELTQPVTFARGDAPSLLLLHGALDPVVWPRNARALSVRMETVGGRALLVEYPFAEHFLPLLAFLRPFDRWISVVDTVDLFIQTNVRSRDE